ncbi:hypothetical protein EU805_17015 [Salipiger sp. IMCC34102]|uniref:hypothetical protein n=1 Tax=Salipiger sp. IMCC34102 TaxID=2510647 RepID=UPI00101BEF89|nr:hypothetical protein [Salipiger sp. IMCC34102]RYH00708.1 hypothetical protein EU805_17015 [Salipiger sp. IMCC34102]
MRRAVALISVVMLMPGPARSDTARDLATLLDAPIEKVSQAVADIDRCADRQPGAGATAFRGLIDEAAAFAAGETLPGTRELLADFTRQIVSQLAVGSGCTALADLWDRKDPWLRMLPEAGIGLSQADIEATERLEALGRPLWDNAPTTTARSRLLALWDSFDPEDDQVVLLWLTRLNAWAPAVEEAWEDLDADARVLSTRVAFDTLLPDAEDLEIILGHDDLGSWIGGRYFLSGHADLARFEGVTSLAKAGYFGGSYYSTLADSYRMAIDTMTYMGNSMASMGLLFDMMDMNTQY